MDVTGKLTLPGRTKHSVLHEFITYDKGERTLPSETTFTFTLPSETTFTLHFLNSSCIQIIFYISQHKPVKIDRDKSILMPDVFPCIDDPASETLFSTLMAQHSSFCVMKNPSQDSPYSSKSPWIGERNAFLCSSFIPLLASLYESGIYDVWFRRKEMIWS
jgi:hypothetical protein